MACALGPWVLWTGGWRKWLNCGKHVHTECKAVCKCPLLCGLLSGAPGCGGARVRVAQGGRKQPHHWGTYWSREWRRRRSE